MTTINIKIVLPETFDAGATSYITSELEALVRSQLNEFMSASEIAASIIDVSYDK